MTTKCHTCRHYEPSQFAGAQGFCTNLETRKRFGSTVMNGLSLNYAREICNKEGDGIFVYFEPKTPAAGAAVQPDDWRKEINKHFGKAA